MSRRIHGGTRCSGELRPDILSRRLSEVVAPIHKQLVIEAIAVLVYAKIRGLITGDSGTAAITPATVPATKGTSDTDFLVWADKVIELASKSDQRMNPEFSLEMSVAFVSDPQDPTHFYASAFASNPRLTQAWTAMPDVEEFAYWDNTDGPDEVSSSDWESRGQIWDRVLGYQPWTKVGVCWEAETPSALMLFITDTDGFLRRVAVHLHRLELERRRDLVRRRNPENMARIARVVAYTTKRTYTAADLAANWDREEATERARSL